MLNSTDLALWLWLVLSLLFATWTGIRRSPAALILTVAGLVAALAAFLRFFVVWQVAAFAGIAFLGFLLTLIRRPDSAAASETVFGVERVVGRDAIVIVPIDPQSSQGRVRVENETWHADSESGEAIPDGTMVQVIAVRGDRVVVRPLPVRNRRVTTYDYS